MRATAAVDAIQLSLSAIVFLALSIAASGHAQQIQFNFGRPTQVELTPPRVDLISSAIAARIAQAQALVADRNWDEAADTFCELAADETDRVVALDDGRYVNLGDFCNLQIANLPAEGLEAYRRRVDPLAEAWYRAGIAERDERQLRRIVNETFCSSWGDDALLALGEFELERGNYNAARRHWEQISPLLRAPDGQSEWVALRDIDIDVKWPEIQRRWSDRSQSIDWLAFPDTRLNLADIRARLILSSVRAGELDRAQLELEVFRRLHPDAVGRFGGQEGSLVAALKRLLSSAADWPQARKESDWPTFAGAPRRSPHVEPVVTDLASAWSEPIALAGADIPRVNRTVIIGAFGRALTDQPSQTTAGQPDRPLSCYPVVIGQYVIFADALSIRAADIDSGRPAITSDGVLYRERKPGKKESELLPFDPGGQIAHGTPQFSLTVTNKVTYGRVGQIATSRLADRRAASGDRLIGIDLRREGLLTFSAAAEKDSWSFDGTPIGDDRHLFVAMRRSDVTPHTFVACFDAVSGTMLWRTSIGAADTPAAGAGDEITHNLLTFVEDRIYFNSNLGLVAALDAATGKICWLRQYDRLSGDRSAPGGTGPLHFARDPAPALYHNGLVVVAPADTLKVFALDSGTGRTVWENDQMADGLHLLGVEGETLAVGGNRMWGVDVRSGRVRWVWPESEHAGIRGMGRGVVAGDEIFWPTRNDIYAVNITSGARTRSPISIAILGNDGANLAVGHGRLVVAGPDKLMVFGPRHAEPASSTTQHAQLSNN